MMLLIILLYISVILNIALVLGMVLRKRGDEDMMTIGMKEGLRTD
jgi:hypothetical protein